MLEKHFTVTSEGCSWKLILLCFKRHTIEVMSLIAKHTAVVGFLKFRMTLRRICFLNAANVKASSLLRRCWNTLLSRWSHGVESGEPRNVHRTGRSSARGDVFFKTVIESLAVRAVAKSCWNHTSPKLICPSCASRHFVRTAQNWWWQSGCSPQRNKTLRRLHCWLRTKLITHLVASYRKTNLLQSCNNRRKRRAWDWSRQITSDQVRSA